MVKIFDEKFIDYLEEKDFDENVIWKLKNKQCSVVMFFAPWCPYCKEMKHKWEQMGKMLGFMNVYVYDIEENKSHFDKLKYELPELVKSYPTIIFYKNGEPFEKFKGERDLQKLLKSSMRICKS